MKHRVNVKENLHTAHSGNLLQLCQSFHNPLEMLTFIYNILNITIKDFRSLLSSPSKDQCVLVILVLDIAQPNKKLRIHLKRGVRNEFDLGDAFTLHLPFSRRSDPFILIAPLASGNGTWSERFLFRVLDPKDKYFSRNVIDLCGAVNDDQANRHQGLLVDDFSEESRDVRYKKGYKL